MKDQNNMSEADKRKELESIVSGAKTAFFVTHTPGEALHGRPMANAKVEPDLSAIWFASRKASGKTTELQHDHQVLLGYTNSSGSEWASVSGRAELIDDRHKIHELWSPLWKNWFDGPDDPSIELIRVEPLFGEYWDNGSKAVAMVKFAVGAVTGRKMDSGANQRVSL